MRRKPPKFIRLNDVFSLAEDVPPAEAIGLSIPVQASGTGPVAPSAWTGWISPAGTIFSQTNYGTTTQYLSASDTNFLIAQSDGVSRDQEITTWFSRGDIYLRLTEAGKAFRFTFAAEANSWSLNLITGFVDGAGRNGTALLLTSGDATDIPGYTNTATATDTFTFGVSGFEVYLQFNGVDFYRAKNIYHHEAGRIALGPHSNNTEYGFRDVTATLGLSVALHGDPATNLFDVRDFGCKALTAVGAIGAGSQSLVLTSNPGFAVGDTIIVETGGEAGGGLPGTRGVGGQWPTLLYATTSAMNADTGQTTGKVAGVTANGNTYKWSGSAWAAFDPNLTYHTKILPRALMATVTAVAGTTLTLDTAATVATTAANVYFNNEPKFSEAIGIAWNDSIPESATVLLPTGDFAFAKWNHFSLVLAYRVGWTFQGQGKTATTIFSPEGTPSLGVELVGCSDLVVEDLGFLGNARLTGGYQSTYTALDDFYAYPTNVELNTAVDSEIRNCKSVDGFLVCIATSYCTNTWARDCEIVHTTGFSRYTQWLLDFADQSGGGAERITLQSPALVPGIEQYRCTGTVFSDITGVNTLVSINACVDWLFENIDLRFEALCSDVTGFPTGENGIIVDINSNAGPTAAGGIFRNFHIVQEGYVTAAGDVMRGFNLSGSVQDVTIQGVYPLKPAPTLGGYIEAPDYTLDAVLVRAIRNDNSPGVIVDGVRVVGGTVSGGGYNVGGAADTIIRNMVADSIGTGVKSNNITNADYALL